MRTAKSSIAPIKLSSSRKSVFNWAPILFAMLSFCAFLPMSASAQQDQSPRIRLGEDETVLDNLLQGEIFDIVVKIHNDGQSELVVDNAVPSCSCTTVKNTEVMRLKPGEVGDLILEINTKKIKAAPHQKKNVKIYSNDPYAPKVIFTFFADVTSLVQTHPKKVVIEGVFDASKRTTVQLLANSTLGFEVQAVKSRNGLFKVIEFKEITPGLAYEVVIEAGPGKKVESIKDPLDMTIKALDGRIVTVGTWVYIEHRDHILVQPNSALRFLNRDTNTLLKENARPLSKPVLLKAMLPETTFRIKSLKIEGALSEALKVVSKTLIEGKRYQIDVVLTEYQSKSFMTGKLIIETDHLKRPIIELPIQAMFGRRKPGKR